MHDAQVLDPSEEELVLAAASRLWAPAMKSEHARRN
jgi:hypothetical protein